MTFTCFFLIFEDIVMNEGLSVCLREIRPKHIHGDLLSRISEFAVKKLESIYSTTMFELTTLESHNLMVSRYVFMRND